MRCLACILVLFAGLAHATGAFAHASLVRAEPADGAMLAQPPDVLKLVFNEPVTPLVMRLIGPGGEAVTPAAAAENTVVTLTPPSSGPSLMLDQSMLLSDNDGWVEASGTANNVAGDYYLRAETPGVDATPMFMQNAPQGYVVGDQIADLAAFDQAGVLRPIRSFTGNGKYLLLDVCTVWCQFCQNIQGHRPYSP